MQHIHLSLFSFHYYPCLSPLVLCVILSNGIVHVNDKSSEKAHLVSVMSKKVHKWIASTGEKSIKMSLTASAQSYLLPKWNEPWGKTDVPDRLLHGVFKDGGLLLMGLLMLSGNCIEGISKIVLCLFLFLNGCSVCVQTDDMVVCWKQMYQLLVLVMCQSSLPVAYQLSRLIDWWYVKKFSCYAVKSYQIRMYLYRKLSFCEEQHIQNHSFQIFQMFYTCSFDNICMV